MWSSEDPREVLRGRERTGIVIARPNPSCAGHWLVGAGDVEMIGAGIIHTSFPDHKETTWEPDWFWALPPELS
jgi:hypothetical protein